MLLNVFVSFARFYLTAAHEAASLLTDALDAGSASARVRQAAQLLTHPE